MRGQHLEAQGAEKRGNRGAAAADQGRGTWRPGSSSSPAICGWCSRVIQRFAGRGENADDLFQVGCIGLIKAIDNFNTNLDVRFSTYGGAHDRGGDPPLSPGQQRRAGVPLHAGHRLQGPAGPGAATWPSTSGSPSVEEIAKKLGHPPGGRGHGAGRHCPTRYPSTSRCIPTAGTRMCVMDQVRDAKNTDESWLERIALRRRPSPLWASGSSKILDLRFFRGQDPDGGVRRGGHLPGAGVQTGEKCHQADPEEPLNAGPRRRSP